MNGVVHVGRRPKQHSIILTSLLLLLLHLLPHTQGEDGKVQLVEGQDVNNPPQLNKQVIEDAVRDKGRRHAGGDDVGVGTIPLNPAPIAAAGAAHAGASFHGNNQNGGGGHIGADDRSWKKYGANDKLGGAVVEGGGYGGVGDKKRNSANFGDFMAAQHVHVGGGAKKRKRRNRNKFADTQDKKPAANGDSLNFVGAGGDTKSKVVVKAEKLDSGKAPLQATLDGQPYYPPNKDGVTRVNVSHLLQNIDDRKKNLEAFNQDKVNQAAKSADQNPIAQNYPLKHQVDNENVAQSKWNNARFGQGNEKDMNANKQVDGNNALQGYDHRTLSVNAAHVESNNDWGRRNDDGYGDRDYHKNRNTRQRERRPTVKPVYPTAPPRPQLKARDEVEWFEEYHQFSLRASVDLRVRIRHAANPLPGSPWPMPQKYRPSISQFIIHPSKFKMFANDESCDILEYGIRRARTNTFGNFEEEGYVMNFFGAGDDSQGLPELRHLNITVLRECDDLTMPHLNMDESYKIRIKPWGASIVAKEVWGALRGLETFSQIAYQDLQGRFVVNKTEIDDYPRFPHRGILLDTARHFLDKETIIANLEAMAQNKMNVFHWHIVDEQSFPFQSKVFPNLTKMGAYDLDHIYTHTDIGEIIEEARLRGIRVIPEFDTPGHTFAWGLGQDFLLTPCYDYTNQPNGFYGPINPILKSTYRFLQHLFTEVLSVFKDKYVHLGGDEVPFDCWENNPFIRNFIRRNNLTDIRDVLSLYERKLLDIVQKIGNTRDEGSGYIVWQEVFDNGVKLKPDAIVQVWMGDAWDVDRVTRKGYRALFSSCWYLDYINYGQDWDKYYKCEQLANMLDYGVKNDSLLIGGEACLWTEFADDDVIMPRLWPRASAAAERLWSSRDMNDHIAAAPRIEEHRCRMKRRGLQVGVLGGPGICQKYKQSTKQSNVKFMWSKEQDNGDGLLLSVGGGGGTAQKNVYLVDMNAMYVVPLVLVVIICCLALLSTLQAENSRFRIVHLLIYPVSGVTSKRGFRGLLYGFMLFVVVWCIWSSPMWLNAWEKSSSQHKVPVSVTGQ